MTVPQKTIDVLHLTTSLTGGAGIAAVRIHESLRRYGINSEIIYRVGLIKPTRGRQWPETTNNLNKFLERINGWLIQRRTTTPFLFSHDYTPYKLRLADLNLTRPPDILHLHWTARWFATPTFLNSVPKQVKIVWSLHDLNPLTGGCHIPLTCDGYHKACEKCPQIRPTITAHNTAAKILERKSKLFTDHEIHVVANSDFVLNAARESSLGRLARSIRRIYIGVNRDDFLPRDRKQAHELLGIPSDKVTIAFNSADLNDHNKNLKFLCDAILYTGKPEQFHLLLIGGGWPNFELPTSWTSLGYCTNPRLLSLGYSAADALVMCSLYETFGMSSVEAQACGTQSFVARTGGLPETVTDYRNTFSLDTPEELASLLRSLKNEPRARGNSLVDSTHDIQTTIKEYVSLYGDLA